MSMISSLKPMHETEKMLSLVRVLNQARPYSSLKRKSSHLNDLAPILLTLGVHLDVRIVDHRSIASMYTAVLSIRRMRVCYQHKSLKLDAILFVTASGPRYLVRNDLSDDEPIHLTDHALAHSRITDTHMSVKLTLERVV